MGGTWGTALISSSAGKVESPVVNDATGQQSCFDPSTVAESEEINRLQNQVTELQKEIQELQKRIKNQDEQLQKADEMNQEMLVLKPQHWLTTEELRIKREQLQQAETDNQRLLLSYQELQNNLGNSPQPDYEAARDRALNKLKVGRQSSAGKAIDAFIKELQRG